MFDIKKDKDGFHFHVDSPSEFTLVWIAIITIALITAFVG